MNKDTLVSLSLLTFFIFSILFWLAIKTLQEGNKGLKDIQKDR